MAQRDVLLDDATMMRCSRCGTENEPSAKFCVACGSALAASEETVRVATLEESPVTVPDWVFPKRLTEPAPEAPRIPAGRVVKFIVLLLVFLGVLIALPGWTIWSTSSALREVGVTEYFKPLPTCEESARAAGQDADLCNDADVRSRFEIGTQQVKAERNRVLAFSGVGLAAIAVATLLLVLAAGLRPWWVIGVIVSPLNLIIWTWACWRVAAWPVRYWERR